MNRFLNRLPTITIREGHRVKVYLTSDLELPAYIAAGALETVLNRRTLCFAELLLLVTALCTIARARPRAARRHRSSEPVQTMLIAYRVQQHYAELRAQYLTILRMAQGLGNLDRLPDADDCP